MILQHASAASMRIALCSVFLTLAVGHALGNEAPVNFNHPAPEWVCPSSTTNASPLTVVPPSRIFASPFNESNSRYCCPGEAVFIDENGLCAENACMLNGVAHLDFATCSAVDNSFQTYSDTPRYPARFAGFHSTNVAQLPNRNPKCCSPDSVCIKTADLTLTEDIDTNYQLLQRMFTCMVVTDATSGQLLDQPFPTEAGIIRVKNQPQRHQPILATSGKDATITAQQDNSCPQGYYCPDSSTRFACPDGKVCQAGSSSPQPCPEDSVCVRQMATAKQFGTQIDQPSLQIPCSRLKRAVSCPTNSIYPIPTPKGFFLDVMKNKLKPCKAGSTCSQGSTFLEGCRRGRYCPDGINEFKCPKGHECQVPSLTSPIPCSAGTYQPAEGEAGLWGFYNADKAPSKIRCEFRCGFGYQNDDADTKCENIHPLVQVLLVAVTLAGFFIVYLLYLFVFRWIPSLREQLRLRQANSLEVRERAFNALNKKLVDRIVLDTMLLPISFERSQAVASAGMDFYSSLSTSSAAVTVESNTIILAQYRAFLHSVLIDALQQSESPQIVRVIVDHPHNFHLLDVAQELSISFKGVVLSQYHLFFTKYREAQEKVESDIDDTTHKQRASKDRQTTVPNAPFELANDIRAILQADFISCLDSWISVQQSQNNALQNMCPCFGGVHAPLMEPSESFHFSERVCLIAHLVMEKLKCRCCPRIRTSHWLPGVTDSRFSPIHTADLDRSPSIRSDH